MFLFVIKKRKMVITSLRQGLQIKRAGLNGVKTTNVKSYQSKL